MVLPSSLVRLYLGLQTSDQSDFLIAEGIMALHDPALRMLYDLKVSGCGRLLVHAFNN